MDPVHSISYNQTHLLMHQPSGCMQAFQCVNQSTRGSIRSRANRTAHGGVNEAFADIDEDSYDIATLSLQLFQK